MATDPAASSGVPLYPEGPDVVAAKRRELVEEAHAYAMLSAAVERVGEVPALVDHLAVVRRHLDHAAAELARVLIALGR